MNIPLSELESSGALNELKLSNRGLEKESLRVDINGNISKKLHNPSFGSALTNPYITTDFSESLLEFITPTFHEPQECLNFLSDIHAFVYKNLDEELLWSLSMPCQINSVNDISIGKYGSSNAGKLKTIYRRGLAQRYGSMMQAISGIHYNFSFSDNFFRRILGLKEDFNNIQSLKNDSYLGIARNFRRYSWLYFILFGASPSASESFVGKNKSGFKEFSQDGLYKPEATSLRMGDLGYISAAQDNLSISINSLKEYCSELRRALKEPYSDYQKIGEFKEDKRVQLNTSIIQIENEYYSTIRPKRVCPSGERPVNILENKGIEYLELRCIDVDPFEPLGIERKQIDFLDLLLVYCLVKDSPPIDKEENKIILNNHKNIINMGRSSELEIMHRGKKVRAKAQALEVLEELSEIVELVEKPLFQLGENYWETSLDFQKNKILNPETSPSAKSILAVKENEDSLSEFGMKMSKKHKNYFNDVEIKNEVKLREAAIFSLTEQEQLEKKDEEPFEEFLKDFLSQTS